MNKGIIKSVMKECKHFHSHKIYLSCKCSVSVIICFNAGRNKINGIGLNMMPSLMLHRIKSLKFGIFVSYPDKNSIGPTGAKLLIKADLSLL